MSDPKFKLTPHPGVLGEASQWIPSMWQQPDPNFSTSYLRRRHEGNGVHY